VRALEPWHLLILAVVFIALFGAKRLPDSARSLGESLHILKKSLREGEQSSEAGTPPAPPVEPKQITGSVGMNKPAAPGGSDFPKA
jgi:sec-independent protein translocase protein TatA